MGENKEQDESRSSRVSRNGRGSSHHHKLAQLEDLGELIAHAEKTQEASVTPLNTHTLRKNSQLDFVSILLAAEKQLLKYYQSSYEDFGWSFSAAAEHKTVKKLLLTCL